MNKKHKLLDFIDFAHSQHNLGEDRKNINYYKQTD